jgi:hypothetical protein
MEVVKEKYRNRPKGKSMTNIPVWLSRVQSFNLGLTLLNLLVYLVNLPNKAKHIPEFTIMIFLLCFLTYLFYRVLVSKHENKFNQKTGYLSLISAMLFSTIFLVILVMVGYLMPSQNFGYYFQISSWSVILIVNLLFLTICLFKRDTGQN